jgi:hypothetical protein
MDAYRITLDYQPKTLGRFTIRRPRKVIPLATKQRLGCILAYWREELPENRPLITVEHTAIGDFEPYATYTPAPVGEYGQQIGDDAFIVELAGASNG